MIKWLIKKSQEFDDWFNNIFFPREPNIEPSLIVGNEIAIPTPNESRTQQHSLCFEKTMEKNDLFDNPPHPIELNKSSDSGSNGEKNFISSSAEPSDNSNSHPSYLNEKKINHIVIPPSLIEGKVDGKDVTPEEFANIDAIKFLKLPITKENISPHYLKEHSQFEIYRFTDFPTGEKKVVAAELKHPENQLFLWNSLQGDKNKGIEKADADINIGQGLFGIVNEKTKYKAVKTAHKDLDVNVCKDKNEKLLEEFFVIKNLGAEKSVTFGLYNIKDSSKIVFNMPNLKGDSYSSKNNFPNMHQIASEEKPAWDQFFTDLYVLNKNGWSHSDLISAHQRSMQNMFTLDSGVHVMLDMDSPMKNEESPSNKDQWLFASNSGNHDALTILRNQAITMASQENYSLSDDSAFLKTNIANGKIYIPDAIQQKMGINQIEKNSENNLSGLKNSSDNVFKLHKKSPTQPNREFDLVI